MNTLPPVAAPRLPRLSEERVPGPAPQSRETASREPAAAPAGAGEPSPGPAPEPESPPIRSGPLTYRADGRPRTEAAVPTGRRLDVRG